MFGLLEADTVFLLKLKPECGWGSTAAIRSLGCFARSSLLQPNNTSEEAQRG